MSLSPLMAKPSTATWRGAATGSSSATTTAWTCQHAKPRSADRFLVARPRAVDRERHHRRERRRELTTSSCSHPHLKQTAKVLSSAPAKPTTAHPAEQAQAQNSPVYMPMENCKWVKPGNNKASSAVSSKAACNWMATRSSQPSQAKHGSWQKV